MVQPSATRCSCIAILWFSLVSFAAITLCVASQRVCCCCCLFRYLFSPETFGYTLVYYSHFNLSNSSSQHYERTSIFAAVTLFENAPWRNYTSFEFIFYASLFHRFCVTVRTMFAVHFVIVIQASILKVKWHSLHLHPKDRSSMALRNVGILPQHYTTSQPRRQRLESSPPWKHQISLRDYDIFWSYTSTPQYIFMAWCLVKHRNRELWNFLLRRIEIK
jgi:hypothetical protein